MERTSEPQDKKPQDKGWGNAALPVFLSLLLGQRAAQAVAHGAALPVLLTLLLVFIFSLPLHCGSLYYCPRPLENVVDKIGCHVMGAKRRGICSYIALKHYERQDWEHAHTYFEIDAQQEFDKAQNYLGDMYYYGKGVARDYSKAKEWFEKSAANGNINAHTWLGLMYEEGKGVEKNVSKAKTHYQQACNGGSEKACNFLKEL